MPRLLIDGTALSREAKGVGRYAYQLCLQAVRRLPNDWIVDIATFGHDIPSFPPEFRATFHAIPPSSNLVRGLVHTPRLVRQLRPDFLLKPMEGAAYDYGVPMITVCHGIHALIVKAEQVPPSLLRRAIDAVNVYFGQLAMRRSRRVVCNSEFLRQAVHRYYAIPLENIDIGYCGIDPRFYEIAALTSKAVMRSQYGVQAYVLTFATGDRHEGAERLPAICAALKSRNLQTTLLVAGINPHAPYADELRAGMTGRGLVEGVDFRFETFLGEDRLDDLARLYAGADFYLELSRHESFGMQLAEALACGTTCVSSGVDGLAEVGGQFAIVFDNDDAETIAATLDSAYARGEHLRANADQIAFTHRFNWDAVGELVVGHIESIVAKSGQGRRS